MMLTDDQKRVLGGSSRSGMSREAALAKRNALTSDTAFGKRIMEGDADAMKELADVSAACVGTPDNWSRFPEGKGLYSDNFGREVSADHSQATPVGKHV
jgi:hypothetical protein